MSLLGRQQKYAQIVADRTEQDQRLENAKAPAIPYPQTRFGIVDGELVEITGQDNIMGMSPVVWCHAIAGGVTVPVPLTEVPQFSTLQAAYQALEQQRGLTSTAGSRR